MKKILFTQLLIIFLFSVSTTSIFAGTSYEKSESYLKILKDNQISFIEGYLYKDNNDTYIPLNSLLKKDTLKNEELFLNVFLLTSLDIKKFNEKYYITIDDYINFSNEHINYNETYNILYTGNILSDTEIVERVLTLTENTKEDFLWLSKIIYAEARGENYDSKLGVGNVVKNRVYSESYPNTIKEVVFDRKFGVQFSPVLDGTIYNDSNDDCRAVALDVFVGINNADKALFFMNPKIAETTWISENRPLLTYYGNHAFYL